MGIVAINPVKRGRRERFLLVLLLTGVCICYFAAAWWWIVSFGGMMILREPTVEAGALNLQQLRGFWVGAGVMWCLLTVLYFVIRKYDNIFSPGRFRIAVVFILFAGSVLRIGVVLTHGPSLSDDIWRYIFDGEVLASGHNPYVVAPGEVMPGRERFTGEYALANRVNNPDLTTIYLPVSQVVFAISAEGARFLRERDGHGRVGIDPDGEAMVFRFVFIGFEMGVMVLLALVLYSMNRSAWYLALYAWHPLAISEIAGEGHQDIVGIFFMVCALALWQRRSRWVGRWSSLLGLSALVKPMTVPVAGLFLRYDRARFRGWLVSLGVGVLVCLLFTVPFFALCGDAPWAHLTATVSRFVDSWSFFGSVYLPILKVTGSEEWARGVLGGLFGCLVLLMLVKRREPWGGSRDILFAGVLLSTTVWPWYLLWSLVIFPIRSSAALWTAALTIPWGYAVLGDTAGWTIPGWLPWLSYGPVYVVLMIEIYIYQRRKINRACNDG